ncbi:MAG: hypothetical protein Q9168_004742 [Polycauliona sp. 1 TL-2023]
MILVSEHFTYDTRISSPIPPALIAADGRYYSDFAPNYFNDETKARFYGNWYRLCDLVYYLQCHLDVLSKNASRTLDEHASAMEIWKKNVGEVTAKVEVLHEEHTTMQSEPSQFLQERGKVT